PSGVPAEVAAVDGISIRVLRFTMTSRCKSGQRRYQGTFVVAAGARGDPAAVARGRALLGRVQLTSPQHEAKPAASKASARKGQQGAEPGSRRRRPWKGSRAWKCSPEAPCGVGGVEW